MSISTDLNAMLDAGFSATTIKAHLDSLVEQRKASEHVGQACIKTKKFCKDLLKGQGGGAHLDAETTLNILRSVLWSNDTLHFRLWGDVLNAVDNALAANEAKAHPKARSVG